MKPSSSTGMSRLCWNEAQKEKYAFCVPQVEYLVHIISAEGLHSAASKLKAIKGAPKPSSLSKLKSFLGLVSYYANLLPNLATILVPLCKLLKNSEPWLWDKEQIAFEKIKEMLIAPTCLYILTRIEPLMLSCDNIPLWCGAVCFISWITSQTNQLLIPCAP